jgi:hypothetical protein
MTVAELLEELDGRDPGMEVRVADEDGQINLGVTGAGVFAGHLVLEIADV